MGHEQTPAAFPLLLFYDLESEITLSIKSGASQAVATSTSSTDITNNCIIGGLKLYTKIDTSYIQPIVNAYLGIDKTKVLTPSSTIDGGTY